MHKEIELCIHFVGSCFVLIHLLCTWNARLSHATEYYGMANKKEPAKFHLIQMFFTVEYPNYVSSEQMRNVRKKNTTHKQLVAFFFFFVTFNWIKNEQCILKPSLMSENKSVGDIFFHCHSIFLQIQWMTSE